MNGVLLLYCPKWQGKGRPGLELVGHLEEGAIYGDSACRKYSTIQSWSWGRLIGRVMAGQCQPLYGHFMSGFVHHCICRALYGLWHLLVG